MNEPTHWVVLNGSPVMGYTITGPFDDQAAAVDSVEFNNGTDAWVMPVYEPEDA